MLLDYRIEARESYSVPVRQHCNSIKRNKGELNSAYTTQRHYYFIVVVVVVIVVVMFVFQVKGTSDFKIRHFSIFQWSFIFG